MVAAGHLRSARRADRASTEPGDRKSTRLNSSHTVIYTLSLHDALPISRFWVSSSQPVRSPSDGRRRTPAIGSTCGSSFDRTWRSEEHTSELQSHRDLHSFPTRRSSDLQVLGQLEPAREIAV